MFYFCFSRGFSNLRRSVIFSCVLLLVSGLFVVGEGIYVSVLANRTIKFVPTFFAQVITAMACIQIGGAVMGIVGARRAPLIHSQRGRNIYLFVFTLLSVVQLLVQLLLSVNVYVVNQCFANEDLTGRCCFDFVQNIYQSILENPGADNGFRWFMEHDSCYGLTTNDTIAWLGPNSFSAAFPIELSSTQAHIKSCFAGVTPAMFNASMFDPDYVRQYQSSIPQSCVHKEPVFARIQDFNYFQFALCLVMLNSLISAVLLSCCKFRGVTVEGYLLDTGIVGGSDGNYIAL